MNDGGAGWLVIVLENSKASELSLSLPLALFSFSPLRGLFLICSFPFPRHTQTGAGGLQTAVCLELERQREPAHGENALGEFCSNPQRLDLGGIAAYALVMVSGFYIFILFYF